MIQFSTSYTEPERRERQHRFVTFYISASEILLLTYLLTTDRRHVAFEPIVLMGFGRDEL